MAGLAGQAACSGTALPPMPCHFRDEEAGAPPFVVELCFRAPVLGRTDQFSSAQGRQYSGTDPTMAAGGRLTNLARTRSCYSGEPVQYAAEALRAYREDPFIPEAHGEQAVLESHVMTELGRGGEWWAHPVGIAGMRLAPGRPVVVLDGHSGSRPGRKFPMADFALARLLPFAEPGIQVNGVMRLRVGDVRKADLHLELVDTDSRLVLRGTPGTRWRDVLAERRRDLEEGGLLPLWDEAEVSSYELEDEREFASLVRTGNDLAWLGSGLLRRIAMFQNFSTAYSTRSWITGDEWIFELDTLRDVPLDHDGFLDRLMDEILGLPLRITRRYCDCRLLGRARGYQCTFYLEHRHPDVRGVMQIRFRWGDSVYGDDVRDRLEDLDADQDWLDRVLPRRPAGPAARTGGSR
ncbi:hypothetical protein ACFU67_03720 [Streptomyces rhizosphaericola]|uniref:hypothetical protein n=1 Tax=Streptomyces rhizosphaericola TaxID=2564098 RepID=UPI0036A728A4